MGSREFIDTIRKVLKQDSFAHAAKALSAKIRSHKRTPVQQAAGEQAADATQCQLMQAPEMTGPRQFAPFHSYVHAYMELTEIWYLFKKQLPGA